MRSCDSDLSNRAVAGDRDALAKLLARHGPAIRQGLADRIPARWQSLLSVDDVVQQTYIDAFLDVERFVPRGEGAFAAWLSKIAERNLLDALRMLEADKRGKGREQVEPGGSDESFVALYEQLGCTHSTPSRHAARREARICLEKAIEHLPRIYHTVVRMYDLEDRPVEEVAATLDRNPGAVYMLRARAHRHLNETMGTASQYLSDSG